MAGAVAALHAAVAGQVSLAVGGVAGEQQPDAIQQRPPGARLPRLPQAQRGRRRVRELAVSVGQAEDAREPARLAATRDVGAHHGYTMPGAGQLVGGGQPHHARAHDEDLAHGA